MSAQMSFASLDFAAKKKQTKRDVVLAEMAAVVPWVELKALIEPHYPKLGSEGGRRPFPFVHEAAHLLPAAMVHPFRSRRRGGAL
jgi:hypothetical protein